MRTLRSRLFLAALLTLVLVGAGCSAAKTYTLTTDNKSVPKVCAKQTATCISYAGQTGKNALELLKQKYTVEASEQGFVNAINKTKPGAQQFWGLYLNGQAAAVGAKDLQTKDSDTIEWKITSF